MTDRTDIGRVASPNRLSSTTEPQERLGPSGFDPARKCDCRLCRYDDEFAAHIAHVPEEHRAFFDDLKSLWEHADFDAQWHRGCVGGEEYTVEFCDRYDAELARITRRHRDSDRNPEGQDAQRLGAKHESAGRQASPNTSRETDQHG